LAQSDKVAPLPEPGANVNVYWVKPKHGSLSPQQKRFGFGGPARRVVHAGPNQSMRRDARGAATGCLTVPAEIS
jgi:hypothetical protein